MYGFENCNYQWQRNRMLGSDAVLEYYVKLITDIAPEDEPLTIDDVEQHSNLYLGSPEDPAEAAYIDSLFPVARKAIEGVLNKPIGEQEYELGLSAFPFGWIIEFPLPPLIQLLSINYTKDDDSEVTLYDSTVSPETDPGTFRIETNCEPGALFLKSNQTWPLDILAHGFPVKMRFLAGIVDIPAPVKQAMRMTFGHFWENRENTADKQIFEVPQDAQWLCQRYAYDIFR